MKSERQLQEVAAMLLIGDGVLALVRPTAHCAVWRTRYAGWNAMVDWFATRPMLVRAGGAIEAAAGLWLAERQFARLPLPEPTAHRLPQPEPVPDSVGA